MRKRQSGFSLIELLVVIAIIMVVAAMATPSIMNAMDGIRLRSSASEVAGIMQRCRQRAVRDNRYYTVKPATVTGARAAYVDLNYNDVFDAGAPAPEPMIQLSQSVTVVTAGAPNTANLIGQCCTTFAPQNANILPSFNARGLPCVSPGGNPPPANSVCNIRDAGGNTVGFVYYMNQTRAFGALGWAAVSVTPAGRIRVWTYDGATWQ
ncbi:MAG TPA: prepilin-type N-terminal cleavage/methylation domain-containing protein [Terriglobales bacterium]|nr:prepilin-type N-terminal cleavage/methylation domain-containing protein [Terriglobales bacterium]